MQVTRNQTAAMTTRRRDAALRNSSAGFNAAVTAAVVGMVVLRLLLLAVLGEVPMGILLHVVMVVVVGVGFVCGSVFMLAMTVVVLRSSASLTAVIAAAVAAVLTST